MSKKESHLNMIQQIVTRMGNNSFMLKGWSIGVMIAIFTFAGENSHTNCIIFTIVPLVVFWFLDSYYLLLEGKFRLLYDDIRKKSEDKIDYDMNFNNISIKVKDASKICFLKILFSISEAPFYVICIITTLLIYLNI